MISQLTRTRILEAVLFASDIPVEMERLSEIIDGLSPTEIMDLIDSLNREYEAGGRSFRLVEVAGGFQFETLPQYGSFIEKLYHSRTGRNFQEHRSRLWPSWHINSQFPK